MSRVFVVQRPVRKDPATRRWVDKYDLSPAEQFGRLVEVLPVGNVPSDLSTMMRMAEEVLADFGPEDHLMAVGDPIATAVAVLVLARRHRSISILKWDRRAEAYRPVSVAT